MKSDSRRNWFKTAGGFVLVVAGLQLAIQPYRGHAMSRPDQAVWLIQQLNAKEKLDLVCGYSHYAYGGLSVEDTVATALPSL